MRRLAAAILLLGAATAAESADAQSFNCRYAHFADEATICQQPALARLDNELAAIFGRVMRQLSPAQRKWLDSEEDRWVVARRQCNRDSRCIDEHYRTRMGQLAALIGEPPTEAPADGPRPRTQGRSPASAAISQPPEPPPAKSPPGVSLPPKASAPVSAQLNRTAPAARPSPPPAAAAATPPIPESGGSRPTIQWVDPQP